METEKIQRCIDNGSDIRDALAAKEELTAIETALAAKDDALISVVDDDAGNSSTVLIRAHAEWVKTVTGHSEESLAEVAEWFNALACSIDTCEAAISPPTEPKECEWLNDPADDSNDMWQTDCGHDFSLNDGTPSDNDMEFCHYCGKKLVERGVENDE